MSKLINVLTVLGRATSLKTFCDAVHMIRKDNGVLTEKGITGRRERSLNEMMQFQLSEILNSDYYTYDMLISIISRIGAYTQTERKQREKSVSLPVRDTDILSSWKYSNIETLKKCKGRLIVITSSDHKLPNGFFNGLKGTGYSAIETPKNGYYEYKILTNEDAQKIVKADLEKQRELKASKSGGKILIQKPKDSAKSKESTKDKEIQELKAMFQAMAEKIATLG